MPKKGKKLTKEIMAKNQSRALLKNMPKGTKIGDKRKKPPRFPEKIEDKYAE